MVMMAMMVMMVMMEIIVVIAMMMMITKMLKNSSKTRDLLYNSYSISFVRENRNSLQTYEVSCL